MIFSAPHITRGAASQPAANSAPPMDGLSAEARLRGTAVTLAGLVACQRPPYQFGVAGFDGRDLRYVGLAHDVHQ